MKIGLVGLNQTGKTSLFDMLTGKESASIAGGGKGAPNVGTGFVPDERIDYLSGLYKPKKTTYARIELTDIAGFSASAGGVKSGAARFLNDVRPCDALVHVLRAFDSDAVIHDLGSIDPARDLESVETEMMFADLEMIERRIARINAGKKITKEHQAEIELLQRCFAKLEDGGSIKDIEFSESESLAIRGYSFLTLKPRLAVVNMDEEQWTKSKSWPMQEALQTLCSSLGVPFIELCVATELEITRLPEDDRQPFMEELGIAHPGIDTLAKAAYALLGLISFMTVGGDEVRAWTIEDGTAARAAAGKIHTDIERGFIRAEVVKYDDLFSLGSMVKVKEKGLFKLEGKEYVVADGDIINFRFNI